MALTSKAIEHLPQGEWLTEDSGSRTGALRAKGGKTRANFYFRYKGSDGKRVDLSLGPFCTKGTNGLSLADAKARANELRTLYISGVRDLKQHLEEKAQQITQANKEAAKLREQEAKRSRASLQALIEAYVNQLRRDGKVSAKNIGPTFKRALATPFPELAAKTADDVTTAELAIVLRRLVENGKRSEAQKLRSYLVSAYRQGVTATQSASASSEMVALGISKDPARDLAGIKDAKNAKKRSLSVAELRAYWRHLNNEKTAVNAALRFHLLTGGLRQQQLGRATLTDFDPTEKTITLKDTKGNSTRFYTTPLSPLALQAMEEMRVAAEGPHLFTLTQGRTGLVHGDLSRKIKNVVAKMEALGELEGGAFTPGDLRRTVETQLAALGIDKETRGRLQSHGIGGVQDVHYNMHDYLPEKRNALNALELLITGSAAKIVQIRQA